MENNWSKKVVIDAPVTDVWVALTDIGAMQQWMGPPEMRLEITTGWEVGSPVIIRGFHHLPFENKGRVLEYVPHHVVSYNFLSSVSRLPDQEENYTVIRFLLVPEDKGTSLSLTLSNFPTETIYHHLNFYWSTTLILLKRKIETRY